MVYRCQNVENPVILTEITILIDFRQISKIRVDDTFQGAPAWPWNYGPRDLAPETFSTRLGQVTVRRRTLESIGNTPNHRLVLWENRDFAGRNSLAEVYGGARVCQESCAWGRDNKTYNLKKYNMHFSYNYKSCMEVVLVVWKVV